MIKRVKNITTSALLSQETYRDYIQSFESETIRGIATLVILKIIMKHEKQGSYGYQILKELKESTDNMLIIEEGRLYPLLRKLEFWGPKGKEIHLVTSKKVKHEGNRIRNYYFITENGKVIYNHLKGVFVKMLQSISNLIDIDVEITKQKHIFCPNCANLITDLDVSLKYCEICGLNVSDLKKSIGESK
jgi:PadR family transcriptional regulator